MALVLSLAVFVSLGLVFGTLSWSRYLQWRFDQYRIARRIGRRPTRARLFQEEPDVEQASLGSRLPRLRRLLIQSGSTAHLSQILVLTLALAGIGVLVARQLVPGVGVLVGILPSALPIVQLMVLTRRRRAQVTTLLPKAIEFLISGLRAGQSLPDALRLAATSTPAPLGPELAKVAEESALGIRLRVSLRDLQDRVPETFELRMVVGALLLNQETGGNLIESLSKVIDLLRERRVFTEKLRAATAEARMSAMVLAGLPVLAFGALMVAAPEYLSELLAPGLLRTLFVLCLAWMGLGLVVMSRFTSPEALWRS